MKAKIYYHDIGDYLDREEKLRILKRFGSFANPEMPLQELQPNEHGDWISVRNDAFETFIPLGDKEDKTNKQTFFLPIYSNGLKTQRDAWVYDSAKSRLSQRVAEMIAYYNEQREVFAEAAKGNKDLEAKDFLPFNASKISWTRALLWDIEKQKAYSYMEKGIVTAYYRPFFKQCLYFDRGFNEMVYQIPKLFPSAQKNLVICVSGVGVTKDFTAIISNIIPDLELIGKSQCFPLYYYEESNAAQQGLFDSGAEQQYTRRDGISDFILARAQKQYGKNVGKEDIFYYVYGFLHSPEYRQTFAADLKKMLPRLPLVENVKDFWAFSKAGRALADLHLNYETAPHHPEVTVQGDAPSPSGRDGEGLYRVQKMRFPAKDRKDTILYNNQITIENIPAKAYEYVVNGKSALEWIMERYQITTHKDSDITNDPNDWALEHGKPRYILDLLLSIIHVSCETMDIVAGLPKVNFASAAETSCESPA